MYLHVCLYHFLDKLGDFPCNPKFNHCSEYSTYNADFDGDEMNVHFPQDEVSRAEGYNIVNANNQYVRPSNGEPIRSLIQVSYDDYP
jgi:DNA-directed RNA polymerase I subunit RPA1